MNGILPLWKPRGMTSHDCVFKIRKMLRMKKVGHTGTLDPQVDGVLPICLGQATKIAEYITNAGKIYEGEVTIGKSTTTEDAYGETVAIQEVNKEISAETINDALQEFHGEIIQKPPMFSAVKVNGKRLYEYARRGIEIERPTRKVFIYDITLLAETVYWHHGKLSFRFRVHCSKGTYIRTLAVMIGEKLGYPAHMSDLTRVASASFTKNDCVTFEQLENMIKNEETIDSFIRPLEEGISYLPFYEIDSHLAAKIKNGAVLPEPSNWPTGPVIMVYEGKAMAIYQKHPTKNSLIKPVKVFTF